MTWALPVSADVAKGLPWPSDSRVMHEPKLSSKFPLRLLVSPQEGTVEVRAELVGRHEGTGPGLTARSTQGVAQAIENLRAQALELQKELGAVSEKFLSQEGKDMLHLVQAITAC